MSIVAPTETPVPGLRRLLTCRVPPDTYYACQHSPGDCQEALTRGVAHAHTVPLPGPGWPGRVTYAVAVAVEPPIHEAASRLASHFDGSASLAAGWLLTSGLGHEQPAERFRGTKQPVPVPVPLRRPLRPRRQTVEVRRPAVSGAEVKARREGLHLSQRQLATAAGVSRGIIAALESGRRSRAPEVLPAVLHALDVAEATGTPPSWGRVRYETTQARAAGNEAWAQWLDLGASAPFVAYRAGAAVRAVLASYRRCRGQGLHRHWGGNGFAVRVRRFDDALRAGLSHQDAALVVGWTPEQAAVWGHPTMQLWWRAWLSTLPAQAHAQAVAA